MIQISVDLIKNKKAIIHWVDTVDIDFIIM